MRFKKIIFILTSLTFVACDQETILKSDNELKVHIEKKVVSGQESLDLKELTDFHWDSLIILTPYTSYDDIGKEYDISLSQVKHSNIESRDDISQLIFFGKGQPIRMIEYPRFSGDFSTNNVEFIERDSAIFDIVFTTEKTVNGDDLVKLTK